MYAYKTKEYVHVHLYVLRVIECVSLHGLILHYMYMYIIIMVFSTALVNSLQAGFSSQHCVGAATKWGSLATECM